ncbi:MSC_0622 family F1-like ATPase gamma subunit [Mycoplasmopsis sturni]|uniref:MSC_0622 family F1-like ATPase gamma subunit n=1 Tax=Mycoplasmopsis sturni TaxID=39047 RepID=UPI000560C9ED|nr:hypothetical protein [Mycoplasmopsis sturni]
MNLKKLQNKFSSLNKIATIVETEKNVTLINILRLSKQNILYSNHTMQSKYLIDQIMNQYDLNHPFLKTSKYKDKYPTLWIYITEEEKYQTNPYFKQEKSMLRYFNISRDAIVAIGKRANDFAKKNNFKIVFTAQENDVETLAQVLPKFIKSFLELNQYCNVNFVLNSSKVKMDAVPVLPLDSFNLKLDLTTNFIPEDIQFNKLKVYPNVNLFINSQIHSYLTFVTLTLLSESIIISEKYKLVAQNQKINDLEKKQSDLKRQIMREKRELEIEQMSILSNKKDLLHNQKGGEYEQNTR